MSEKRRVTFEEGQELGTSHIACLRVTHIFLIYSSTEWYGFL